MKILNIILVVWWCLIPICAYIDTFVIADFTYGITERYPPYVKFLIRNVAEVFCITVGVFLARFEIKYYIKKHGVNLNKDY